MKNLAGDPDCDREIERELTRCGIEIVRSAERSTREAAASISGKLGAFAFKRAWYYWVVEGPMPLELAIKLYEHPVGRDDIRTGGYAGNIDPREYGTYYFDADGNQLSSDPTGKEAEAAMGFIERGTLEAKAFDGHRFVPDKRVGYTSAFVRLYHVDSELGLYVLAHAIRCLTITTQCKHGFTKIADCQECGT
jgi:hypothetical protein